MQTKKEALLALYRGEKADYMPSVWSNLKEVLFPGERYIDLTGGFDPYGTGADAWGVLWTNQGPDPVTDGNTVAKDYKMFDNMDEWKEHVKFPPLDFMPVEDILKFMSNLLQINPETDLISCIILSGQFERMNQLIGMENALCAFYEYPDEVHEFFDAMCEYKLKCIDLAYKYLRPDIINMQDDWGTGNNMFFSPDIWREFIKPNEIKYTNRIHELGMLYEHHSCGYIQQIIPDLVEIGVDCIQPVMVCNDIDYILKNYGNKITIKGGINNQKIDTPESTEEDIRSETRQCMDRWANKGRYIPYYVPTSAEKLNIFDDEVVKYGETIFQK